MKKIGYKLIVGAVFAIFVGLGKLLFSELPISDQLRSDSFLRSLLMMFILGYVLLGNLLWVRMQNHK